MDPSLRHSETRSDISDESHEETLKGKILRSGKRDKKEKYEHLGYVSSEEEFLVTDGGKPSKTKKNKISLFPKPKEREKISSVGLSGTPKQKDPKLKSGAKLHKSSKGSISRDRVQFSPRSAVFGVSLLEAVENSRCFDGIPLPAVVRMCIDYVNENGLDTEGIYRLSASKSQLEELKRNIDAGDTELNFADPICAAGLLKFYLRELPHSILDELTPQFEAVMQDSRQSKEECLERMKNLLARLPTPNYTLMGWVILHLKTIIEHERQNKMGLQNVGLTFTPTLRVSQGLMCFFLTYAQILFAGIRIEKYKVWRSTEKPSLEIPTDVESLQREISKYDKILQEMHSELSSGIRDPDKEQRIWDMQRHLTQLKRKWKTLKQQQSAQGSPVKIGESLGQPGSVADTQPPAVAGPCLEMFEEKQLLAVQMYLRDQIAKETRTIEELMAAVKEAKARKAAGQLPTVKPTVAEVAQSSPEEDQMTQEEWKARAHQLMERRTELISKIAAERYKVAHLQAQIELLTISAPKSRDVEATRL